MRLTVPSEFWVIVKVSQAAAVVRLAISHELPAFAAVTYLPLALASRGTVLDSGITAFEAVLAAESAWPASRPAGEAGATPAEGEGGGVVGLLAVELGGPPPRDGVGTPPRALLGPGEGGPAGRGPPRAGA